MRKTWVVARHEFKATVKRVWFVVATFVFPLFMLGIGVVMLLVTREVTQKPPVTKIGLVDAWGELRKDPAGFQVRRFADEASAKVAVLDGSSGITTYVLVPADYLQGGARVKIKTARRPTLLTSQRPDLPAGLADWLVEQVLGETSRERVERAKAPLPLDVVYLDASGSPSAESPEALVKRSVMAYAFFLLLFMSIFTASQYLLQGMGEEKEHRVMEMVLSSVTPMQLMTGKLLGLGAAGLLQLFVWVCMGVAGALTFAVGIVLEPALFFFCLVFFLLGYALYGSLMLGFGALGTNFRESQQMASLWSFVGTSPIFVVIALLEEPHGVLARVFSFIPFTAPMTMMFRYTIDPKGTPVFDIVAAILLLAGSTWFAVKLSARLYRAGLLLYGKRPRIREIWRWILAAR